MAAKFLWDWVLEQKTVDPSILTRDINSEMNMFLLIDAREIAYDIARTIARNNSQFMKLPGNFEENLRRVPKNIFPDLIKNLQNMFPKAKKLSEALRSAKNNIHMYLDTIRNVLYPNAVGIINDGVAPYLLIDHLRHEVLLRNLLVTVSLPGTYIAKIIDEAMQEWLGKQYEKNISTYYSGQATLGESDSKALRATQFYLSQNALNSTVVIYSTDDRMILSMLEYYGKNRQADIYIRRDGQFLSIRKFYSLIKKYVAIPTLTLLTAFLPGNVYLPPLLGSYTLDGLLRVQQMTGSLNLINEEDGTINWPNLRIFFTGLANLQLDALKLQLQTYYGQFASAEGFMLLRKNYYREMLLPVNSQLFPLANLWPDWNFAMLKYAEALQWYIARTITYSENLNYSFSYPYPYAPLPIDLQNIPSVTNTIWLQQGPRLTLLDEILLIISREKGLGGFFRGKLADLSKIGQPLAALFPVGAFPKSYEAGKYIFPRIDQQVLKILQNSREQISAKSYILRDYVEVTKPVFMKLRYG